MTRLHILSIATLLTLALTGCSGTGQPHSYCHKLSTALNSYNHNHIGQPIANAAQRATITQEYKDYHCDDQ